MNQYHADDPARSPVVMIGRADHRRLTRAALIDTSSDADRIDFLLYELDRAQVVEDDLLPSDIVRLGSIVRTRMRAHKRAFRSIDRCQRNSDISFALFRSQAADK